MTGLLRVARNVNSLTIGQQNDGWHAVPCRPQVRVIASR